MEKMAISWLFVLLIYVLPVILGILICIACWAPFFGMIRGRREAPPAVVSSDSARRHIALIWLIRVTGVLIAVSSAYVALVMLYAVIMILFRPPRPPPPDLTGWLGVECMGLLLAFLSGSFCCVGWRMLRKTNSDAVAVFAFIFSFLTAVAFHHFLLRAPVLGHHPVGWPWSYRAMLSLIAFLIFQRVIKAYLLRVLVLNPPKPPQNPPPSDPKEPFGRIDTVLSPR
jgi:hypothetical protein